jgi:hypothetical protein
MEKLNKLFKSNGLNLMISATLTSFLIYLFEIYIVNVLLCTELFKNKFKY